MFQQFEVPHSYQIPERQQYNTSGSVPQQHMLSRGNFAQRSPHRAHYPPRIPVQAHFAPGSNPNRPNTFSRGRVIYSSQGRAILNARAHCPSMMTPYAPDPNRASSNYQNQFSRGYVTYRIEDPLNNNARPHYPSRMPEYSQNAPDPNLARAQMQIQILEDRITELLQQRKADSASFVRVKDERDNACDRIKNLEVEIENLQNQHKNDLETIEALSEVIEYETDESIEDEDAEFVYSDHGSDFEETVGENLENDDAVNHSPKEESRDGNFITEDLLPIQNAEIPEIAEPDNLIIFEKNVDSEEKISYQCINETPESLEASKSEGYSPVVIKDLDNKGTFKITESVVNPETNSIHFHVEDKIAPETPTSAQGSIERSDKEGDIGREVSIEEGNRHFTTENLQKVETSLKKSDSAVNLGSEMNVGVDETINVEAPTQVAGNVESSNGGRKWWHRLFGMCLKPHNN